MPQAVSDIKRQCVLDLASKYQYEENHATRVEAVALQIFDLVENLSPLSSLERNLLSHSSLLHDIGNFINKSKHNKHSRYIILKDKLLDCYENKHRQLLSLIVYNHRRKIHKDTLLLPKQDKNTVLKLSSILRVADALDYTRGKSIVRSVSIEESRLLVYMEGQAINKSDIKLNSKKKLFCDFFNIEIIVCS